MDGDDRDSRHRGPPVGHSRPAQRAALAARLAEPDTLGAFADSAALFDALHGPDGDPAARNAILAALVRGAQAGAEAAITVSNSRREYVLQS